MFLNLPMLLGLLAISIPIIIHLLNKRKFQRVQWAAMRFVKVSVEQNQRRIQMEDLLLLILRCLLVALLAIALARPVLRAATGGVFGNASVTAVVVIDNSYSMSATDGVNSRLDLAKKAAEDVIRTLPAGSSVAVTLASDVVREVIPEPTFDTTLAIRVARESVIFDRPTNLLPAINHAIQTLDGRRSLRKEIYVISDGQASGWRAMDTIRETLESKKKDLRTYLVFVGQDEGRNLGISSLRLDGGLAPVNVPVRVEAQVTNYGRAEATDVPVTISVDGEPAMDQATIASVPAGESRSVSLFARLKSDGHHTITARLPEDHLPADDTRTVAMRGVKDVKVLLVDGEVGSEPRESETFFLRNALRPVPRAEWDEYYVKPTVKTATELDGIRFEDFDCVIACNVTDFSATALSQLTNYVKAGGSLWFFLGDNVNPSFYNQQLHDRLGLLPAKLGRAKGDDKGQETWFSLQDRNYQHQIVGLWKDPAAGNLSSAKIFKTWELVEGGALPAKTPESAPAGVARTVVRYADNSPAVMERDWGLGRVILFASSADTEWTDFPVRAGTFVPLMHRTLSYLVGRQDEYLTMSVGGAFHYIAPIEQVGKDALISRANVAEGEGQVRESRRIELTDGIPRLNFEGLDFGGAYEAKVGDEVSVRFAAQPDPGESSLDTLSGEQYRLLDDVASVVRWQSGASIADRIEQARVGTELWLPLATIALGLATMETLLAHWFSRSK